MKDLELVYRLEAITKGEEYAAREYGRRFRLILDAEMYPVLTGKEKRLYERLVARAQKSKKKLPTPTDYYI